MNRQKFLETRRKGIGGSDIGVLLGLSKYRTPHQLWLDKTGRADQQQDTEITYWGRAMEPIIKKAYEERTGSIVHLLDHHLTHPDCSIAIANVDGIVGDREKVLEIKTVNAYYARSEDWGAAGTDEIPPTYLAQVQWYMGISGLPCADLAALVGGQELRIYHVDADADLFAQMLARAEDWWQRYVLADTPPPPSTEGEAKEIWPQSRDESVDADDDMAEKVRQLKAVREQAKELKQQEQELRDIIAPAFGAAAQLTYQGNKIATYKSSKGRTSIDWEAAYKSLNPDSEHIQKYTKTQPGTRSLRIYL